MVAIAPQIFGPRKGPKGEALEPSAPFLQQTRGENPSLHKTMAPGRRPEKTTRDQDLVEKDPLPPVGGAPGLWAEQGRHGVEKPLGIHQGPDAQRIGAVIEVPHDQAMLRPPAD